MINLGESAYNNPLFYKFNLNSTERFIAVDSSGSFVYETDSVNQKTGEQYRRKFVYVYFNKNLRTPKTSAGDYYRSVIFQGDMLILGEMEWSM